MEKKLFHEIFTIKNVLLYVLKVLILFLILFFTFFEPTALIYAAFLAMPVYIVLYLGIVFLLSKFPKAENAQEQNFFKRHILKPLLLLVGVGIMFLGLYAVNGIKERLKVMEAHAFIEKAEEIIEYNTNTIYVSGVMETNYKHDMILVDYDTMTVGFIHHPYVSAELTKIKLKNKSPIHSEKIQREYELSSPGAKFTSFYPEEDSKHRTTAIEIEMEDGSFYSIDGLVDKDSGYTMFLGLR
ncbi:MAG: hypothetical protein IJZ72_03525 [Oscillospiraceae bacterium]|nr:hypothetical protein [Oscillospiraceae bacterium]